MGRLVAAGAGIAVAAMGHALDVHGQLPFVHESQTVRLAMSPADVVVWLAVAGVLAAVAVSTRVLLVAPPAAVAISAAPELIARRDPGAIAEPAALLGAALQLLLLVAVVLLAAALERRSARLVLLPLRRPAHHPPSPLQTDLSALLVDRTAAPRGPPRAMCS